MDDIPTTVHGVLLFGVFVYSAGNLIGKLCKPYKQSNTQKALLNQQYKLTPYTSRALGEVEGKRLWSGYGDRRPQKLMT